MDNFEKTALGSAQVERPRAKKRASYRSSRRRSEAITGYLFLLPDALGLFVFVIVPIGYAFFISLHDWNALSPMRWTGFDNYVDLWYDRRFWSSLRITGLYTIIYVPLLYAISLGLALLVNQRLPLMNFFRTIFFIPVVLSLVVSSLMWKYIFDERVGLLNYVIGLVGIEPQAWLGSVELALPSIIIVSIWIQMGYFMVIFVAGLQDISALFYDAAKIDGANHWQQFWRITLPLLRPTSLFVVVISLIGSFQVFDQIWVMTRGGPADATQVTVVYIYQQAFQFFNLGYGSAMAFALFIVIMVFSLVQFRVFRSVD
ncbi:MAG: sugar ABC transporter permease [Deinococcota bacterium]